MSSKTCTIGWSPFSEKHKNYIKSGFTNKVSVAEGAVRSGKTIDNCIIFMDAVERSEDKLHLATGSTLANAKMNIGDCNGFGLEHLWRGRCHWGKYEENIALYVRDYKNRQKIIIFAGGGKADSFKKILGNSYGCWIATEINEHYDCDDSRTSFIKVAMARQIAAKDIKIIWDLNPSSPNHKIYTDYIDKWKEQGLVGGYNYYHFTIADNLSISEERRKEIESQYDRSSVWFKRDILGERCVAEGIIHQSFANDPKRRMITKAQLELIKNSFIEIECGIDFGGNTSKHTFVATAFTRFYQDAIVLKSVRIEEEVDSNELNKRFVMFCQEIYNNYKKGFNVNYDNAEPVLARSLTNAAMQNGCRCNVIPAWKNHILQRIRLTETLDSQGRLWYVEGECDSFVKAISSSVWDSKHPDERLDNGTSDIDTMDAFEYSLEKKSKLLLAQNKSWIKELING